MKFCKRFQDPQIMEKSHYEVWYRRHPHGIGQWLVVAIGHRKVKDLRHDLFFVN